jgi:hypothetical protein
VPRKNDSNRPARHQKWIERAAKTPRTRLIRARHARRAKDRDKADADDATSLRGLGLLPDLIRCAYICGVVDGRFYYPIYCIQWVESSDPELEMQETSPAWYHDARQRNSRLKDNARHQIRVRVQVTLSGHLTRVPARDDRLGTERTRLLERHFG